jgi:type IV/VI secretion system ImpK/VasF family protein
VQPVAAASPFKPQSGVGAATIDDEISERTDEFAVPEPPAEGEPDDHTADVETVPPPGFFARLLGRKSRAAAAAEAEEVEPGFLHAKFRQFYSEILRFKNQKTQVAAGFQTAIVTDYAADISPDATAQQLSNRLKELLDLQMAEAAWMRGEYAQRYPQAQYAMAALADEIFTEIEWPGQVAWPQNRLETRLFKSSDADLEVFKRIDRLLREEYPSAEARDLARVYLLVLASGFRGKWRPFGLKRPIADYRRRLYEFIADADPLMIYADDHRLMAQAAEYTLVGQAVSRFTAAQRWAALLVLLIVTYVVTAHIAWGQVSSDIKDLTTRIVSSSAAQGAP